MLNSSAQFGFVSTLANPECCFLTFVFCFFPLTAVQKKAALEKESKLSILEAGVADVSTAFYLPSPILKTGILGLLSCRGGKCTRRSVRQTRLSFSMLVQSCWCCRGRWSELRGGSLLWLM